MKKIVNYYRIKLGLTKISVEDELVFAYGIKTTGDPVITTVTFTDAQIQALADIVRNDAAKRITAPSKTLTRSEQEHLNDLTVAIETTKNEVEVLANKFAKGDRIIFEEVVTRVGLMPRASSKKHASGFAFHRADAGCFHVGVPTPGAGRFTYFYKYGITTDIDVPPTLWQPAIALPVTELIVSGFRIGTIIGLQYAVLAHPKKIPGSYSEILTLPPVNSKGKITLTHNVSFLQWSEIIYYVVSGADLSGKVR